MGPDRSGLSNVQGRPGSVLCGSGAVDIVLTAGQATPAVQGRWGAPAPPVAAAARCPRYCRPRPFDGPQRHLTACSAPGTGVLETTQHKLGLEPAARSQQQSTNQQHRVNTSPRTSSTESTPVHEPAATSQQQSTNQQLRVNSSPRTSSTESTAVHEPAATSQQQSTNQQHRVNTSPRTSSTESTPVHEPAATSQHQSTNQQLRVNSSPRTSSTESTAVHEPAAQSQQQFRRRQCSRMTLSRAL